MYRRRALDDAGIGGQYFDEDFFAYREGCRSGVEVPPPGWTIRSTVPSAVALHRRRVTPERRASLPKEINYHSVKNRFLLRLKQHDGQPLPARFLAHSQAGCSRRQDMCFCVSGLRFGSVLCRLEPAEAATKTSQDFEQGEV
jgi:hypothetical protein